MLYQYYFEDVNYERLFDGVIELEKKPNRDTLQKLTLLRIEDLSLVMNCCVHTKIKILDNYYVRSNQKDGYYHGILVLSKIEKCTKCSQSNPRQHAFDIYFQAVVPYKIEKIKEEEFLTHESLTTREFAKKIIEERK